MFARAHLYGTLLTVSQAESESLAFGPYGGIYSSQTYIGQVCYVFNRWVHDCRQYNSQALHQELSAEFAWLDSAVKTYQSALRALYRGASSPIHLHQLWDIRDRLAFWLEHGKRLCDSERALTQKRLSALLKDDLELPTPELIQQVEALRPFVQLNSLHDRMLPLQAVAKLASGLSLSAEDEVELKAFFSSIREPALLSLSGWQPTVRDLGTLLLALVNAEEAPSTASRKRYRVIEWLAANMPDIIKDADPEYQQWWASAHINFEVTIDSTPLVIGREITSRSTQRIAVHTLVTKRGEASGLELVRSKYNALGLREADYEGTIRAQDPEEAWLVIEQEARPFVMSADIDSQLSNALATWLSSSYSRREAPTSFSKETLVWDKEKQLTLSKGSTMKTFSEPLLCFFMLEEAVCTLFGDERYSKYLAVMQQAKLIDFGPGENFTYRIQQLLEGASPNPHGLIDKAYLDLYNEVQMKVPHSSNERLKQLFHGELCTLLKTRPVFGPTGLTSYWLPKLRKIKA